MCDEFELLESLGCRGWEVEGCCTTRSSVHWAKQVVTDVAPSLEERDHVARVWPTEEE